MGTAKMGGGGAKLYLPSLTSLSGASCGRQQLQVPPLGYFSRLQQVVDN